MEAAALIDCSSGGNPEFEEDGRATNDGVGHPNGSSIEEGGKVHAEKQPICSESLHGQRESLLKEWIARQLPRRRCDWI